MFTAQLLQSTTRVPDGLMLHILELARVGAAEVRTGRWGCISVGCGAELVLAAVVSRLDEQVSAHTPLLVQQ